VRPGTSVQRVVRVVNTRVAACGPAEYREKRATVHGVSPRGEVGDDLPVNSVFGILASAW
jgi:hypothetical protein